ncbi:MAG: pilus assembly FimT family protein [Cellulosilyticaceae bacterium]
MKSRGFTLLEMVAVLALIGIGYIGIHFSVGMVSRTAFEQTIEEVVQVVELAQTRASLQNKKYQVIVLTAPSGDCITLQNESIGAVSVPQERVSLPRGVTASINNKEKIVFNGDLSPSQAGTIRLSHERLGEVAEVRIRPVTGKVAVYRMDHEREE